MKHCRRWSAVLLLVLLLLSGCKKKEETPQKPAEATSKPVLTAEDIYGKARYATRYNYATEHTITWEAKIKPRRLLALTRSLAVTNTYVISEKDYAMNVTRRRSLKVGLAEVCMEHFVYIREENDKTVSYVYASYEDQWYWSETEYSFYRIYLEDRTLGMPDMPPEGLRLEEQTQQVDGTEAYVLVYSIAGKDFFGEHEEKEIREGIDAAQIVGRIYVDKQTYMPLRWEQSVTNIEGPFSEWLYGRFETEDKELYSPEFYDFKEYNIIISNMNFDPVEVPEVPEEGRRKALQQAGIGIA